MLLPNIEQMGNAIFDTIAQDLIPTCTPPTGVLYSGILLEVGPTLLRAYLPGVKMGELCRIEQHNMLAEVVTILADQVLLSPYSSPQGLSCPQWVTPQGDIHRIAVGPTLCGRILDGLGNLIDSPTAETATCENQPSPTEWRALDASPPNPLLRQPIDKPMILGIRAIDGLLTCAQGQRMGIFAAAGTGKSTLLGQLCQNPSADVIVLALIGERGREVREFLEQQLPPNIRDRTVVIVATSDKPALERVKGVFTATTIAEYFRDTGMDVLLLVDSLTRYARAAREVGLAAGEAPASGSYPPSVFAALPRLLERAGNGICGSITAFYTVLVEGDDLTEPLADEVISLLDGHIILSRQLASAGHYPAIDIQASVSRVMDQIITPKHRSLAQQLRQLLSTYQDVELLLRVGEYHEGQDPLADKAVQQYPTICSFLRQQKGETLCDMHSLLLSLEKAVSSPLS
ncbi:MAG: FliI/YscN family ATPase [Plesiomonas sp.]